MSESRKFTMQALAEACGGRLIDATRGQTRIGNIAFIESAGPEALTWIQDPRWAAKRTESKAAAILGTDALLQNDPRGIVVQDVELALVEILDRFEIPQARPAPGVHPAAIVDRTARIAPGASIGAHAVVRSGSEIGENSVLYEGSTVGADVRIGRDCVLYPQVAIYDRCEIGDRVVIHAGAVIGADGFNYVFRGGRHRRVPQIGNVVIEDDVEIGANSCIDRAKTGCTRIGKGTKIDNLVQVGHNSQVGPLCILAGQTGLAGSVRLGTGVVFGGQGGCIHSIEIGDRARIGVKSIVWHDLPPDKTYSGMPAQEHKLEMRERARVRQLAEWFQRVTDLTKRIEQLEAAAADHSKAR